MEIQKEQLKPNHLYLISFVFVFSFATAIQTGYVMGENSPVSFVLAAKFGWDSDDGTALLRNSWLSNCSIIGVMIGAISGSKIIQVSQKRKISLFWLLIYVDIIGIIVNCAKMVRVYPLMLTCKIIAGIVGGISNVIFSKMITETVPIETLPIYGQALNSCFCLGVAIADTVGLLVLPPSDSSIEDLKNGENWRIVYGVPVVICHIIPLTLISVFFRHPSLRELLGNINDRKELSKDLDIYLKRIYFIKSDDDLVAARCQVRLEQKIGSNSDTKNDKISPDEDNLQSMTLLEGVKDKKFRFAILNAQIMSFYAQGTGISVYVLSTAQVFIRMKKAGKFSMKVSSAVQILVWMNWFATFYGAYPVKMLGQRKTQILGQVLITVSLFGCIVCEYANNDVVLVMLIAFIIFTFQGSSGPITFMHAQETAIEASVGLQNATIFLLVMITSFMGPVIQEAYGAGLMFIMFFVISLTGIFYLFFFMQETTYVYETDNGSENSQTKRWMTLEEKKYVYTPKSLSKIQVTKGEKIQTDEIKQNQIELQ